MAWNIDLYYQRLVSIFGDNRIVRDKTETTDENCQDLTHDRILLTGGGSPIMALMLANETHVLIRQGTYQTWERLTDDNVNHAEEFIRKLIGRNGQLSEKYVGIEDKKWNLLDFYDYACKLGYNVTLDRDNLEVFMHEKGTTAIKLGHSTHLISRKVANGSMQVPWKDVTTTMVNVTLTSVKMSQDTQMLQNMDVATCGQVMEWLAKGNGFIKVVNRNYKGSVVSCTMECEEKELNDYITSNPKTRVWLRRFDEKEWHDPTLAYMFPHYMYPQGRVKEN